MTITYLADLSPNKSFNSFRWLRAVMFRWHGSVFRLIYTELLLLLCVWYALFAFLKSTSPSEQEDTSRVIEFVRTYQSSTRTILSFILVYFYQSVYARASTIFMGLPFPDNAFLMISTHVGKDDKVFTLPNSPSLIAHCQTAHHLLHTAHCSVLTAGRQAPAGLHVSVYTDSKLYDLPQHFGRLSEGVPRPLLEPIGPGTPQQT